MPFTAAVMRNSVNQARLGLVFFLIASCAQAPAVSTTTLPALPSPTLAPTAAPLPSPIFPTLENTALPLPALSLDPAQQTGQTFTLAVGEVLQVLPPDPTLQWQLDYTAEILQPLTPPENMLAPGAQGWLFLANSPGTTGLGLTSIVHCDQPLPCPGMPLQFSLIIEVR